MAVALEQRELQLVGELACGDDADLDAVQVGKVHSLGVIFARAQDLEPVQCCLERPPHLFPVAAAKIAR